MRRVRSRPYFRARSRFSPRFLLTVLLTLLLATAALYVAYHPPQEFAAWVEKEWPHMAGHAAGGALKDLFK